MRGIKKVSFKTEKQSANDKTKKFVIILAACVVLVLSVSLILILSKNDFDFRSALGGDMPEETTAAVQEETHKNVSEADDIFLLWCASKDRSHMRFIWLIRAQMPERRISICAVDPLAVVTMNGKGVNFEDIYSKSGEKEFVSAIEAYSGFKTDRYFGATEENFKAFINYLGGVSIDVPEQIEYKSEEFNVILVKGIQNMKGDTLFKYFRYLGASEANGRRAQSDVLGEVLKGIFVPERASKRSNIFSKISNSMKTNATIVDFSGCDGNILNLMENGIAEINTVSVLSELTK